MKRITKPLKYKNRGDRRHRFGAIPFVIARYADPLRKVGDEARALARRARAKPAVTKGNPSLGAITTFLAVCLLFITNHNLYGYWANINSNTVSSYATGINIPSNYTLKVFQRCSQQTLTNQGLQYNGGTAGPTVMCSSAAEFGVADDSTTFVKTGDISAMWVRDSCAQVYPYLLMCKNDPSLQRVVTGVMKRHMDHFNNGSGGTWLKGPYRSSWNGGPDATGSNYVPWEPKFESDGIPYVIRLCYLYWKITGDTTWAVGPSRWTGAWDAENAFSNAVALLQSEQNFHHTTMSDGTNADSNPTNSVANPVYTGMVWNYHRPSDDESYKEIDGASSVGAYNIPDNMFIAAWLPKLAEMYDVIWSSPAMRDECNTLATQITNGIENYGTYNHSIFGKMYMYETRGDGTYELMDDANVPNLLSAPYIGYCDVSNTTYQNTRKFILSPGNGVYSGGYAASNPYYYSGGYVSGLGSPHTNTYWAWPLGIIMQGLTTTDPVELQQCLDYLEIMDAGLYFMHESANVNAPGPALTTNFTREWFMWPCQLYSELILRKLIGLNYVPAGYGATGGTVYIKPLLTNHWQYANLTSSVTFGNTTGINIYEQGIDGNIQSATIDGTPTTIDPVYGVQMLNDGNPHTVTIQTTPVPFNSTLINLTAYYNDDRITILPGAVTTGFDADCLSTTTTGTSTMLRSLFSGATIQIGPPNANNVVQCTGQPIVFPANTKGVKVRLYATAINGGTSPRSLSVTANYSSGSPNTFSGLVVPDWCDTSLEAGTTVAVDMGHRHDSGANQTQHVRVYEYPLPVDITRVLTGITLSSDTFIKILAITVSTGVLADLFISPSDITFPNASPNIGDLVSIYVNVHNTGDVAVSSVQVWFSTGSAASTVFSTQTISAIAGGGYSLVSTTWTVTAGDQNGNNTIYVTVDPNNLISEVTKSNNQASQSYPLAKADLTLSPSDINFSDQQPAQGEIITTSATIHNIGYAGVNTPVTVWFSTGTAATTVFSTQTIPSISSGSTVVVYATHTVASVSDNTIYVTVNPLDSILESNYANNSAYQTYTVAQPTTFTKYQNNPILMPKGGTWESKGVSSPAVVVKNGVFYMFYRAQDWRNKDSNEWAPYGISSIGVAKSVDGYNFTRPNNNPPFNTPPQSSTPILTTSALYGLNPAQPYVYTAADGIGVGAKWVANPTPIENDLDSGGLEYPRIVHDSVNNQYIITYVGYNLIKTPNTCIMWATCPDSVDLTNPANWTKRQAMDSTHFSGMKNGAIVTDSSGTIAQINGKYYMYYSNGSSIWLASNSAPPASGDWSGWTIENGNAAVLSPRTSSGYFDENVVEPGPPPIYSNNSITLYYNGSGNEKDSSIISRLNLTDGTWSATQETSIGYAVFTTTTTAPTQVTARPTSAFLAPEGSDPGQQFGQTKTRGPFYYERLGQRYNTIYAEGLVNYSGRWYLYYGGTQWTCCLATAVKNQDTPPQP